MFSCTGAALTKLLLGPTVCGGKWKESQMTTSKPTKKHKGEVSKNDWPKLPVIEEYCNYGALNRYINLPACFHKDKKWPLYCPQGSGTLRQQLLIMQGIAWFCIVLHSFAWYCMVLYGIA